MSVQLKRGETVSLNALARQNNSTATQPVILSNSERVRKLNDLNALYTIMKVRGV